MSAVKPLHFPDITLVAESSVLKHHAHFIPV